MLMRRTVSIGLIAECPEAQTRPLDPAIVAEYVERLKDGDRFPPLDVRFDGKKYWLWDGYHRLRAARQAGIRELEVRVEDGGLQEAIWDSCSANKSHGLRRTNAQKQEAVRKAISLKPDWSDRKIGQHCGVDSKTVAAQREIDCSCVAQSTAEVPQLNNVQSENLEQIQGVEKSTSPEISSPEPEPKTYRIGQDGKRRPIKQPASVSVPNKEDDEPCPHCNGTGKIKRAPQRQYH